MKKTRAHMVQVNSSSRMNLCQEQVHTLFVPNRLFNKRFQYLCLIIRMKFSGPDAEAGKLAASRGPTESCVAVIML